PSILAHEPMRSLPDRQVFDHGGALRPLAFAVICTHEFEVFWSECGLRIDCGWCTAFQRAVSARPLGTDCGLAHSSLCVWDFDSHRGRLSCSGFQEPWRD